MNDTIVALATPLGRSGIGVIRLSGGDSLSVVQKLLCDPDFEPVPRRVFLKKIFDPDNDEVIDEVLVTYFKAPQSFTGEDVVEISPHGSPVIIRQIIDLCLNFDARLAQPGEFSLRALANGRMNLSQAEAIRDLIDSQTVAYARQAIRQMRGELSFELQPLKDELLNVIIVLESAIEFVEDDLPDFQTDFIKNKLDEIRETIAKIASTFKAGKLIREGIKVVLIGKPNVGKSSLFNYLLGQERAIVTEIAGTTRDQLHEKFTIDNIPISLVDTAGLRATVDEVESIGVERSRRIMADADLVVVLLDGSKSLTAEDYDILEQVKELNHLIVINKSDLPQISPEFGNHQNVIQVSALTGDGIFGLCKAIVLPFSQNKTDFSGFLISDARHFDLLLRAQNEIENSIHLLENRKSEEIVLIGLHNALRLLGQITGETSTEEMLTRIFSTFCIGK